MALEDNCSKPLLNEKREQQEVNTPTKGFNPSYEVMDESFGINSYSVDCCMCNPQRC